MKVKEVMTPFKKLITCDIKDNLQKVCQIFQKNEIGAIIVFHPEDKTLGIITKSDIIEHISISTDMNVTAKDLMKTEIIYCQENDEIDKVSEVMYNGHLHHMVVKNEMDVVTGIISSLDVAGTYSLESQKSFTQFILKYLK